MLVLREDVEGLNAMLYRRNQPLPRCPYCELEGLHGTSDECLAALRTAIARERAVMTPHVTLPKMPPRPLSVAQAAVEVGVTPETVWQWIHAGKVIARHTAGGALRIEPESLWRARRADQGAREPARYEW